MDGFFHRHRQPIHPLWRDTQPLITEHNGIEYHAVGDQVHIKCSPEDLTTANEFRDMYFRYLMAKRDYPWAQHDPPSLRRVFFFEPAKIARECEREFYR